MSLSIRRLTFLATALVIGLAMSASAALAQQYPPPQGLALVCERDGNEIICVLSNAEANEVCVVVLTQRGSEVDRQTETTSAEGQATYTLTASERSAAQATVRCEISGAVGTNLPADGAATPGTPVSRPGTLPFTGAEVGVMLAVALGLLGTGLVALRRREDRNVSAT